jgi:hypothetical protein
MAGSPQHPSRSLEVVLVDSGEVYPIEIDAVERFAQTIQSATGIDAVDQILLTRDGGKVDAAALLQSPTSSRDRGPLVLFNRRTLGSGGIPEPCVRSLDEIVVPDSSSVTYAATATTNPAMAVIQTYERTFCLHVDQARAYLDGCRRRHEFVLQNASRARNQVLGMHVAIANLKSHTTQIKEAMATFLTQFEQDGSKHRLMLERVEEQLTFMGGIDLDESVRRDIETARQDIPEARTLLQCCEPEEQLRKHAAECGEYISSLHAKVSLVPTVLDKLEREVQKIVTGASVEGGEESLEQAADNMPPSTVKTARGAVWVSQSLSGEGSLSQWLAALHACGKHSAPNLGRLQEITTEMESHHEELRRLLQQGEEENAGNAGGAGGDDEDSPTGLSGSMTVHFAVFDERHKLHERELLPELKLLAEAVGSQVTASCEARTLAARFVASQLHRVSAMQYAIVQQVRNKLDLFQAGLARQARAMDVFEHLFRAPPAYSAFLLEKGRRDQYSRTVSAATASFVQTMETYREEELRLRDEFLNAHGRHLPKPFHDMPVMATRPGRVDVHAPPPLPGALPAAIPTPQVVVSAADGNGEGAGDADDQAAEAAAPTPAATMESLLARVTELELENGRLRAGRRVARSPTTRPTSSSTASDASAVEAPSIDNLESSMEDALTRCWEASGGSAEGVDEDEEDLGESEGGAEGGERQAGEKPDVALLVERISNSREALKKAESRLAAQAGEVAAHVEAQEQLTRELTRLQETDSKYRAFVSAVLRAEQAATRAAAGVPHSGSGRERGLAGLSASMRESTVVSPPKETSDESTNPLALSAMEEAPPPGAAAAGPAAAGAAAPPPRIEPQQDEQLNASMEPAPSVGTAAAVAAPNAPQAAAGGGAGRASLDASTSSASSAVAAGAGAGERRGSGGSDWLETLAETVCMKLETGATLRQELEDASQQQQQQQQQQLAQSTVENSLNASIIGDEESYLAFSSVDVNDLVLFYPVVLAARQASAGGVEPAGTLKHHLKLVCPLLLTRVPLTLVAARCGRRWEAGAVTTAP